MAHALVDAPVEPKVELAPEVSLGAGTDLHTILDNGVATEEFCPQNARASTDCVVGSLFEALVNPLTTNPDDSAPVLAGHVIAII